MTRGRTVQRGPTNLPYREISRDHGREFPACASFEVSVGKQIDNGRRVMMPGLGKIAAVIAASLILAAATIPTTAEAADLFIPRGPVISRGPVAYGGGGC